MITAKLLWTEYPYDAGFCITDDTDTATLEQTKAVYDFLLDRNFVTTKTVWPFKPSEPCGIPATPESTLRGITLQNPEYFTYCKMLSNKGFEICLHSASAGNNKRESMIKAFDILKEHFGSSDTFICHAKNAENIYWENKVTRLFPFNFLIKYQSKHKCFGEMENSEYFWGDICKEKVNWIRLFRTRDTNTLKRNPSMPYHDNQKPFVNYWFSATKRRIFDCATSQALDRLKGENGLTVLYQYLHRYADPTSFKLNSGFVQAVENLSSDPKIHVSTVSKHMHRLIKIRGIVVLYRDTDYWILNTNTCNIYNLQCHLSTSTDLHIVGNSINQKGSYLVIPEIEGKSCIHFQCDKMMSFKKCKTKKVGRSNSITIKTNTGEIKISVEKLLRNTKSILKFDIERKDGHCKHTASLPILEEYRLLTNQMLIIVREILFKGRSINSNKYLDTSKPILLENHNNW
ncbi:hypothetical protein BMS3Abin03_00054 [bacterium BMS3Abin03]|nr:hypothetical protein BMS3Abin03_00054 [bacterium BMS3Abin03]